MLYPSTQKCLNQLGLENPGKSLFGSLVARLSRWAATSAAIQIDSYSANAPVCSLTVNISPATGGPPLVATRRVAPLPAAAGKAGVAAEFESVANAVKPTQQCDLPADLAGAKVCFTS